MNGANLYSANLPSASQLSDERLTEARQKYALPDRFFLYLGGFDVRKNVGSILAGYQAYLARGGSPAVKLVIAGKLPSEESNFFPDPQRRVAEMELGEQVYFCGWVDDEDKQSLYQLATAYLFPSLYEGFGMTIIEAMVAGTPVVTSKS